MKYRAHIKILGLPRTTNSTNARGWRARMAHARTWKRLIREWLYLNHATPEVPLSRAKLTCIRHSSKKPDFCGLVGSFKAPIDALVDCGVLVDDNMDIIGEPTYQWVVAKQSQGRIEIIVEEA